ncbi:hypothetical protein GW17_00057979 [Ensete ventricosum]|nr:hypothetical protein GW17_00057979 [Ensete ventricosum]
MMQLETYIEYIGSSPRIRSLPRWHKGVCQKKTDTHPKIVKGSRKACWELESNNYNITAQVFGLLMVAELP